MGGEGNKGGGIGRAKRESQRGPIHVAPRCCRNAACHFLLPFRAVCNISIWMKIPLPLDPYTKYKPNRVQLRNQKNLMSSTSLLAKHDLHQLQKSLPRPPWRTPQHNHLTPPPQFPLSLPRQQSTVDSFLASIKSFTTQGLLSHAFAAYSTLQLHSTPHHRYHLTPLSISSLLLCSAALRALPQGKQLHAHVLSLGLLANSPIAAKLVTFYAGCELLDDARAVVEGSGAEHPLPWNVLIAAYVRNGLFGDAVLAYRRMAGKGVRGDVFTYPSVLKACGELQDMGSGREVQNDAGRDGFEGNLFVQNALVSMYAKCGAMDVAREVFDGMLERDSVSWNAMISGYASRKMWNEALELFEMIGDGETEVNVVTWNTIAGIYLQMGNHMKALRLVSQIRTSRCAVDHVTFVIGLRACSHVGLLKVGKEIHGVTIRTHCNEIETVRNALITMLSRCNNTGCASILFRTAEDRSLVTWNCMITGYCLLGQSEEASLMFREMVWSDIHPNYVTVVTILSLCARVANLQHGKELHCYITKHGFEDHRLLWNSLVDMYSKSGRVKEARRVFDSMNGPDEVSYTSLIAGYGMQGEGHKALKLFDEMIRNGIKPDHVTMVAVLSACSHAGLVVQGQMLFDKMASLYGVVPLIEHYNSMVDLFGRAGLLSRAEKFLNTMPLQPTTAMWASLVGACQIYRNNEIGERAARRLLEMRPENPGHYVLIANMYATAGCWEGLAKVRVLMRDRGIRKVPGCAWVNVGNRFYPFLVGDRKNSDSCEIYSLLEGLSQHLKDAGYVDNEHLEFDEEVEVDKEGQRWV